MRQQRLLCEEVGDSPFLILALRWSGTTRSYPVITTWAQAFFPVTVCPELDPAIFLQKNSSGSPIE